MPEGLEAEIWRQAIEVVVGREVHDVWVDERVAPPGLADVLVGRSMVAVRRRGKVVLLDWARPADDTGPVVLGLHFGMTGRVVVDGISPIERLEYASSADRPDWDRLRIWVADDNHRSGAASRPVDDDGVCSARPPAIRMSDPRRLGRVTIDPHLDHLGPDAFSVGAVDLRSRLSGRRAAIKTLLLDQSVVAGLGNLCADEVLFWAGVAPGRPADELGQDEITTIARVARRRLSMMLRWGGSTTGTLDPATRAGPRPCPRDGALLVRTTIGGRTAVWCPRHQR